MRVFFLSAITPISMVAAILLISWVVPNPAEPKAIPILIITAGWFGFLNGLCAAKILRDL